MKKKKLHSGSSPETLANEWLQTVAYLKKMEFMARVTQETLPLMPDQYMAYNAVIIHAQEALVHVQGIFDAVGKLTNSTILH